VRRRRAERERADHDSDRQPAPLLEVGRDELHAGRVHPCEESAGQEAERQRRQKIAGYQDREVREPRAESGGGDQ